MPAIAWTIADDIAVVVQPVLHVDHDVVEAGLPGHLGEQRVAQRDPGAQRGGAVAATGRAAI